MSDKLKQSISVVPTFTDGEQPPAGKLNALGAQVKRGFTLLERAIGDIKTASWPYVESVSSKFTLPWGRSKTDATAGLATTESRGLDIANLGRLVGPASNLNPRTLASGTITEAVPTGVHEFALRYPPKAGESITFTDGIVFATEVALTSITSAGHYHVTDEGRVYTFSEMNGGNVEYTFDPASLSGGAAYQGATLNVIPDPNQITAGGNGCAVTGPDLGTGRYTATLPTITHQQVNIEGTSTALNTNDVNLNYQATLPRVLGDLDPGDQIPSGFLFLKNESTQDVYEDAEYFYVDQTNFEVGNVDLADAIASGDKFVTVTVGADVTTSIDDLRDKQFQHSHDRQYGEPFIHVNSITGILEEAPGGNVYTPSTMDGNFAPQYLHRNGFHSGSISDRNGMRGPLAMESDNPIWFNEPGNRILHSGGDLLVQAMTVSASLLLGATRHIRATTNLVAEDEVRLVGSGLTAAALSGGLSARVGDAGIKPIYLTGTIDMTSSATISLNSYIASRTVVGWNLIVRSPNDVFHYDYEPDGLWGLVSTYRPLEGTHGEIWIGDLGSSWASTTADAQEYHLTVWVTD